MRSFRAGPGLLVTAAFIGPGTLTTATVAGSSFGYALAWALILATLTAIMLQTLVAELAVVNRQGFGVLIANRLAGSAFRYPVIAIVVLAIFGGNTAYEAGNLVGGGFGIGLIAEALFGIVPSRAVIVLILTGLASAALLSPSYRIIEQRLIMLVVIMALAFLFAAAVSFMGAPVRTDQASMLPLRIPEGGLTMVLGLVGTTVVPYNLFLHAAAAREGHGREGRGRDGLAAIRRDSTLSIAMGGIVSLAILLLAARVAPAAINSPADMARLLEPIAGSAATLVFSLGILIAGLTSAVTAPLAAAFVWGEVSGRKAGPGTIEFRAVALGIVLVGALFAIFGGTPIELILLAQSANGLLLPLAAVFLVILALDPKIAGAARPTGIRLGLTLMTVIIVTILGLRLLWRVIGG